MLFVAAFLLITPITASTDPSVSCGMVNRGSLANAVRIPNRGPGFVVPEPWRSRGLRFGTQGLVGLVRRVAHKMRSQYPMSVLGVCDLSPWAGGASLHHRSHQSGRDVDLMYYAVDVDGRPVAPGSHMPVFRLSGSATHARTPVWTASIPERYFDRARNWALVKALITDTEVEVVHIFVSWTIRRWLLEQARLLGEPRNVFERARVVLKRPRLGKIHNDHIHVRIACSRRDRACGRCREHLAPRRPRGPWRWRIRCPSRRALAAQCAISLLRVKSCAKWHQLR
jgi:penicillin-insensitive murein endopeptidase